MTYYYLSTTHVVHSGLYLYVVDPDNIFRRCRMNSLSLLGYLGIAYCKVQIQIVVWQQIGEEMK